MRMFSSLRVYMFWGIVFLFVSGTVWAQSDALHVYTDKSEYDIGDPVVVTFKVGPPQEVNLLVSAAGVNIISISGATTPYTIPGNYATDSEFGILEVRGTITSFDAYISARWDRGDANDLLAWADLCPCLRRLSLAQRVFVNHLNTFRYPIVQRFFPDVLYAFKSPEIQEVLNPVVISHFVRDPEYIRAFYPDVDDSIVMLLLRDLEFQRLFRDEDFHAVLQNPAEIDKLIEIIHALEPSKDGDDCGIPPREDPKATTLSIVSGYGQEGEPGDTLDEPFVVEIRDQYGNALSGVDVRFSATKGGGRVSPTTVSTGSTGQFQTYLTLGSNPGANWVVVSVDGIARSQTFTATAVAPPPTEPVEPESEPLELTKVSGNNQMGTPNTLLGHPFVVLVSDADGNGVSNIGVRFSVIAGEGELSDETAITGADGEAETTYTFGSSGDSVLVGASIAGFEVTQVFTATATGPAEPIVSSQLPPMYWIEDGALYYRSTDGEKRILLKPRGATLTGGLAVDMVTERVYWTEQTSATAGRIRWLDLYDMKVRLLAEVVDGVPLGVAVDNETGRVYWTTSHGKIQRINIDGSGFRPNLITGLNSPKHIAFDEEQRRLYWTEAGRIRSANLNGTKKILFKQGLGELGGIAVADGVVYWTEQTGNEQGKVKMAEGSGSGPKLLAVLESAPEGLAVDAVGGRLYWSTSHGEIQSVPLTGGIRTVVVGGSPTGIALGHLSVVPASPAAPLASSVDSVESTLLANYPNPFNPETWLPYQLSEAADVTVSIYSVNGALVRTLALGHQAAGIYQSKSRAAYWDGRNDFGESVASGLYFYTLTAGDFTATRKMLIRK